MQQVERRDVPKNGLSPLKGLAIVLVLAVAGGAILLLTKNDPKPIPIDKPNPKAAPTTLTDAEAIAIFGSLNEKLDDLYASDGPSDLAKVLVPGSPAEGRIKSDLRELRRANATFEPDYETRKVEVQSASEGEIRIRQVVVSDGRLVDEEGNDITKDRDPELQTIVWTLKDPTGTWLIFDSLIVEAHPYKGTR